MIKPLGSNALKPLFVFDTDKHHELIHEAESLPSVTISSQAAGNAVMMGGGYFSPLEGFMNVGDAMGCAENMKMSDGSFFPVPILCLLKDIEGIKDAQRIALRDPNMEGEPVLAVMNVRAIEEVSDEQMEIMTEMVYRTQDPEHPGVAAFNDQGRMAISGPIQVLNFSYFQNDYPATFRTAVDIRNEIQERGWKKVVAFQTRNPMHRAHEELCKMAMEDVEGDGLVIHMLLGKLKPGDIPAPVRDETIRKMAELYFPPNTVAITGYGFDMLYAGPREAVLHAYFRQNMGATHFIIGRDHAGVGDYYGAFDAQTIFDDEVPAGALDIEIFRADHTAYSKKLDRVVMMRDAPDHSIDDFVLLSGTKVRQMLRQGIAPPPEFSRPEVAEILIKHSALKPLFVFDTDKHYELIHEAESLPSVTISSQAAGNAVMMGGGYFSPLEGFMNVGDAMGCAENMKMSDGSFFPVPILCLLKGIEGIKDAQRIALRDPNMEGEPVLAVMDVHAIEEVSDEQMEIMTEMVYRTKDPEHPGVAAFNDQGRMAISGPIQVLNFSYFQNDYPATFRTAVDIRNEIQERGWKKVVAFQTRNPMHRAHEELCKMAMEDVEADGLVIHMLLGKLKPGDIPAPVRDEAIRKMAEVYFPPNTVAITGYGFDMLYAGPREAVLHAYFRQNMGASHFIIGRDHAGVGDYYGAFDAQTIFDDVPAGALDIEIFRADHTAYSKKLDRVVMMRDAPDHSKDDFVLLSGTKVREMLGQGIAPPPEFSRPEVAEILIQHYESLN